MSKKSKVQTTELDRLETELQELLVPCLGQSAQGRPGLFGLFDQFPDEQKWFPWPEADRLNELVRQIQVLRAEFGTSNPMCDRFLQLRSLRDSNSPGEAKLARLLLDELVSGTM
jgi:hypothetical protein